MPPPTYRLQVVPTAVNDKKQSIPAPVMTKLLILSPQQKSSIKPIIKNKLIMLYTSREIAELNEPAKCLERKNKTLSQFIPSFIHLKPSHFSGLVLLYSCCWSWNQHWPGKMAKNGRTDEWMKKMWHIYTTEYYSAIKKERKNAICSNMDATRDYHTM